MRPTLGVDWAERHSAAVLLGSSGDVFGEYTLDLGARDVSAFGIRRKTRDIRLWLEDIVTDFTTDGDFDLARDPSDLFVGVEDVHPFAINTKPVLRLQGILLSELVRWGFDFDIVEPKVWQPHFGYRKKEHHDSKKWAREACRELGYEPDSSLKAKEKTDLCDAYLVARFIQEERT